MLNLKKFLIILGLLIPLVTINSQASDEDRSVTNSDENRAITEGPYSAKIIAPRAIVYADENKNTPLGYIANGKRVTVGNPRKKNRELVPLVVYGRIAYIEIRDIQYENEVDESFNSKRGAPREHNVDVTIQKVDELLSENNSIYFSLHQFFAGSEMKEFFNSLDGDEKERMGGFAFQFLHRQSFSRVIWGASFDYSSISSENVEWSFFFFGPTIGYTPLRNPLFLVDIYASLDLSIGSKLDISNNFVNEPSGFTWGPQANARIVFFPERKYHITGGMGIRKYKAVDYKPIEDRRSRQVNSVENIAGLNFFIGAGMEFD